ncbi:Crp/Fnr family transcriptional regulator [Pedobacter sp. MW01-1-1]|uniref:Crp/Fnr family transcriptional regulator n=1 Tax=Pedobacter sp. MW01-1-1 TaxID=3383027 RepID=UPI003FF0CD64
MKDELDELLVKLGITSSFSLDLFKGKSKLKEYPKFTNIFEVGRKNEQEYILISGILHRYNISNKNDVVTTGFYSSQSVVTPHSARTQNGKSIFSLQSLTDVILAEIPVKELDNLRHNNKEFHAFGQQILEAELAKTHFNEVVFRSYSAKERLLVFRKQFQNLENFVSHSIIASYLGITNVSFSRLRNELAKQ